jgi:hypothetical protein
MAEHEERPPDALARGPVTSGDVERVRREVGESDARAARDRKTAAARRERELKRDAEQRRDQPL